MAIVHYLQAESSYQLNTGERAKCGFVNDSNEKIWFIDNDEWTLARVNKKKRELGYSNQNLVSIHLELVTCPECAKYLQGDHIFEPRPEDW